MERSARPDEGHLAGSTVSSFIVRVRREGACSGIVERVRDGVKEPFAQLAELGEVIRRLLRETHLPPALDVAGRDPDADATGR